MRKKFIFLIISALVLTCSLFTACTFGYDFDSCTGNKPGIGNVIIGGGTESPAIGTAFNFEIQEADDFYYPTLEGIASLNYYPSKFSVACNGEEREITPIKVDYISECYVFRFEERIIYGELGKGNHNAVIYAYSKSKKMPLVQTLILSADEDYTGMDVFNIKTGRTFAAMDKESRWEEK